MNVQKKCGNMSRMVLVSLVFFFVLVILSVMFLNKNASNKMADIPRIVKQCMPSSVIFQVRKKVQSYSENGDVEEQIVTEAATGFIWADKGEELLIVTNNHVVEGAESIRIRLSPEIAQGILLSAETVGRDETSDIAVVSVKKSDIPQDAQKLVYPAIPGNAKKVQVGQLAILIGNALGEGQNVSCGIISAVNRRLNNGAFQQEVFLSDAAINFGNSGSMLVDQNGEVIGVNTSKDEKDSSEGMGYYVPIDTVASVVEKLLRQAGRIK